MMPGERRGELSDEGREGRCGERGRAAGESGTGAEGAARGMWQIGRTRHAPLGVLTQAVGDKEDVRQARACPVLA